MTDYLQKSIYFSLNILQKKPTKPWISAIFIMLMLLITEQVEYPFALQLL